MNPELTWMVATFWVPGKPELKVAVPRALFAEILRRIDRLRPRPILT